MHTITDEQIARMTDYAILQPGLSSDETCSELRDAEQLNVFSVCVNPSNVELARQFLKGGNSETKVCAVVGFPHGSNTVELKATEAAQAVADGATEIDYVMNLTTAKDGLFDNDLSGLQDEAHMILQAVRDVRENVVVKVILEVHYFTKSEVAAITRAFSQTGIHFVKTSTGFAPSGSDMKKVHAMLENAGDVMQVKASGGIGQIATLEELHRMGVTRFGMSKLGSVLATRREDTTTESLSY